MVARNSPYRKLSAISSGFDEATLVTISEVIVRHALQAIGLLSSDRLTNRADSFVDGTDVEHLIDLRLLIDALSVLINRTSNL